MNGPARPRRNRLQACLAGLPGLLLVLGAMAMASAPEAPDPSGPDGLRPGGTLGQVLEAPVIAPVIREFPSHPERAWADAPPVIPHSIRDTQLDRNANSCLRCHAAEDSEAPMTGSHLLTRSGEQVRPVAPRRYFCTQCHVPQHSTPAAPGAATPIPAEGLRVPQGEH